MGRKFRHNFIYKNGNFTNYLDLVQQEALLTTTFIKQELGYFEASGFLALAKY